VVKFVGIGRTTCTARSNCTYKLTQNQSYGETAIRELQFNEEVHFFSKISNFFATLNALKYREKVVTMTYR